MSNNASGWRRVNKANPCPICAKNHACKVSTDGAVALCKRIEQGAFDKRPGDWFLHRLKDDRRDREPPMGRRFSIGLKPRGKPAASSTREREGERMSRMFPSVEAAIEDAAKKMGGKLVAQWSYQDAARREVMRVARFQTADGKEYRPLHPTEGGWKIGDPPGPLPLYRLPELKRYEPVWVCEGEKAADAARSIGLNATTSAHGAASAHKTDWAPLAGAEVYILPDNDKDGRHYAKDVARILLELDRTTRVRIVPLLGLPEGGDIVEYIDAFAKDSIEPEVIRQCVLALAEKERFTDPAEVIGPEKNIKIECDAKYANGTARGRVRAFDGDKLLHEDTVDLGGARSRERFAKMVAEKRGAPGSVAEIDALLLAKLAELREEAKQASTQAVVFDVNSIVRPDLFIRPEVIGLSVAQPVLVNGKPVGKWKLYLLWENGEREVRDLPATLDLPDGSKLYFDPYPADPTVSTAPGWTSAARERWLNGEKPPDPAAVFRRLCAAIDTFIEFPEQHTTAMTATLALWVMLSYVYPAWNAVPYLYVGGPLGSGKSRVFEVLDRLVFRPLMSSNMTGPALFRTLHERGGTLLLDEAERLKEPGPEAGNLRDMLLAGYKASGKAIRMEPVGEGFLPREFQVYGPKALACINGLPPALASRCIQFIMFRAPPGSEKSKRHIDSDPKLWADLRDDLHALALGPMGLAVQTLSEIKDFCPFSNRNYELWQPLMALAAWVDEAGERGLLAIIQDYATNLIESSKDDATPDADETLLRILASEIQGGAAPTPGDILKKAKELEPEMFQRWQARGVSNALKRYSLLTNRSNGDRVYGSVTRADLRRVQQSYGVDLGVAEG